MKKYNVGQQVMFNNATAQEISLLMFVMEDNDDRLLVATYMPNSSFPFVLNTFHKSDIIEFTSNVPDLVSALLSEKINNR
jgi:hypothetical protein